MFLPGQPSPNQEQGTWFGPVPSNKGRQSLSRDQGIQRLVTPVTLTHKTIPPKYKQMVTMIIIRNETPTLKHAVWAERRQDKKMAKLE